MLIFLLDEMIEIEL